MPDCPMAPAIQICLFVWLVFTPAAVNGLPSIVYLLLFAQQHTQLVIAVLCQVRTVY